MLPFQVNSYRCRLRITVLSLWDIRTPFPHREQCVRFKQIMRFPVTATITQRRNSFPCGVLVICWSRLMCITCKIPRNDKWNAIIRLGVALTVTLLPGIMSMLITVNRKKFLKRYNQADIIKKSVFYFGQTLPTMHLTVLRRWINVIQRRNNAVYQW